MTLISLDKAKLAQPSGIYEEIVIDVILILQRGQTAFNGFVN